MRDFSTIKNNILKYLDYKGISKYEFYQKTGVSNGVLSQKNGLSEDNIMKFLSYYKDVNSEWLLTGQGEMLTTDKPLKKAFPSPEGIPLVSTEAIAGFGNTTFNIAAEDILQTYVIPDFRDITFMIRIKGSSMEPSYLSGDIVACRVINNPVFIQWNRVHIIATINQGILVKRIKPGSSEDNYVCISDNSEYDPIVIPKSEITGIALVVGFIRLE